MKSYCIQPTKGKPVIFIEDEGIEKALKVAQSLFKNHESFAVTACELPDHDESQFELEPEKELYFE
jgi:hypothetical protein